ncbi:hypothetical protein J2X47_004006 [Sphingomonas sp. BE270]|jgi:hypothetical protein|nr:hypothetical protein [Sphingomonas sp. BE270]
MLDTIARVVLPRTKIGNLHAMDQYSQDPLSPSFDEGAHNRQDTRDSLFLMADFRVAGQSATHSVRVRNLSAGGLMAEFPDGLAQGLRVEFDVRGVGWVPGQIAWSAAGRIGVAFDRQIDPLLARKPVGQGGQTPVFVKPIFPRALR